MMNRRQSLQGSAVLGMLAGSSLRLFGARSGNDGKESAASPVVRPLTPPARGSIPVAFLISEGAVMIDFAGPWEVFQDVNIPSRSDPPFQLYTVAETAAPIHASGGMRVVLDYTIANAPAPKVIVIPAQSPAREKTKEWIRQASKSTDVTMSVCSDAYLLASTGLLSGKPVTAHHSSYYDLANSYPDVDVKREYVSSNLET